LGLFCPARKAQPLTSNIEHRTLNVEPVEHETFMRMAIAEARRAQAGGNFACGAAIVRGGRLVAAGHNQVITTGDPTAHAEVTALRAAAAALRTRDLSGATLYATLEPCPMCAAAAVWARVARVVCGAPDRRFGRPASAVFGMMAGLRRVELVEGVLAAECAALAPQVTGFE
jgi:tRNA(adenine34) deaminase